MLKQNSILAGLILGILIPLVSFGILLLLFQTLESIGWVSSKGFSPQFRERTLGIVSIGLNAIPMNLAYKKRMTNIMRGIVLPTFLYVVIWLLYFGKIVL